MAIVPALDVLWATGATVNLPSVAFSPAANSLILVEAHVDLSGATATATITSSAGLTWTAIGTPQRGISGGFSQAWWAFTTSAQTNMTVSVDWANSGARKAIKPTVWTGTATASAVLSKTQGSSGTNNLTVNVTTTNAGCRVAGTAIDWQANGTPLSSDDEQGYHITSFISGVSVRKAADTATAGTSVPVNFDAATTAAADWAYKVYEILAAAGGGGPVDLTTNDTVQLHVAGSPTLTQDHGTLTVADATEVQVANAPTLTQNSALTVDGAVEAQTAGSPAIVLTSVPWVRDVRQSGTGVPTATSLTVPLPTCVVGDDLWASFTLNSGHGTVTDPSGWTRIFPTTVTDDTFMTLLVYRKTATATEAAGGDVTVTVGTAVRGNAGAIAVVGSDAALAPESVVAQTSTSPSTSVTTTVTTTADNALILSILSLDSGTEDATPGAPLTQQWDPVEATITGQANAGATVHMPTAGSATWTWTWTSNLVRKAWSAAIRSQAAAAVNLTVADAAEAQTADSVTLTQTHALTVADALEVQTADSPALAQTHDLTVSAAAQQQTADAPSLTAFGGLTVGDAVQLQLADAPTLTQLSVLTVDAAVQAHTAASPTLLDPGSSITINEPVQQQTAGSPTLTQLHTIAVDAAIQVLTSAVAAVGQLHGPLAVSFATQAQTSEVPALTQVSLVGGSMNVTDLPSPAMTATPPPGPAMTGTTRPGPTMTGD